MYFQRNYDSLRYPLATTGQPGFRPAQLGAIHAVAGHFAQRADPAIVTMPTGSGKTAVMIACAFVLCAMRVLVVTPSRLVREQIAEELAELRLLRRLTALPDDLPRPKVCSIGERIATEARWRELSEYDAVVGTVQSISPAIIGVAEPPPDQFDLLLVDEAHHSSAQTWQALLDHFPDARRVLFTATPFRRDRREIRGRFVFTYDLGRARGDGVFGRIRYEPVLGRAEHCRDSAVAKAAERQLAVDREAGLDHLLMVRTDRKTRAAELARIYADHTSLHLAQLNSDHSLRYAQRVIEKLSAGDLDGIITVNMLGEGFDLPRLKIAAIHAPHKSLAATLQFIGRFARTAGERLGTATFLAIPDDIEIERERMFEAGAAWQEIVENLSAGQIGKEAEIREVLELFDRQGPPAPDLSDLSLFALEPYHHVKIYRVGGAVDLHAPVEFPKGMSIAYKAVSEAHRAAVWVTRERSPVRWSRDERIIDVRHDLFIVHFDGDRHLLFICSSRRIDGIYEYLARQLAPGDPRILPLARINRALNGLNSLEFFNIGMRNRVLGSRTESYRIITGSNAAQAILPTDGRLYHRGHCYGRGEDGSELVTIGLSSGSKIWSNRTSRIPELIEWCNELAHRIEADRMPLTQSGLDHLSAGEEINQLPQGIFCAGWEWRLYHSPRIIRVRDHGNEIIGQLLDLNITVEHERCTVDHLALCFSNDVISYRATFSFETDRYYEPASENEPEIIVLGGSRDIALIDFINEHHLCFYTDNLDVVIGCGLYRAPANGHPVFDTGWIESVVWETQGVDPRLECGLPRDNLRSVHDYVEGRLAESDAAVVYYDHGSGEVADFIAVTERGGLVVVEFFHCKGAGGDRPGDRVSDAYEVCGQAVKSVGWADPNVLLRHIDRRWNDRRGGCKFIKGDLGV